MTTKEQERKALAQIKKIVEGLGEDSYIGTAFEGCFEIAEQNIENDWACSQAQELESARKMLAAWDQKCKNISEELAETKKQLAGKSFMAQEMANRKAEAEDKWDECEQTIKELNRQNSEMINEIADKDMEIMKLKAKLYDLMTK